MQHRETLLPGENLDFNYRYIMYLLDVRIFSAVVPIVTHKENILSKRTRQTDTPYILTQCINIFNSDLYWQN